MCGRYSITTAPEAMRQLFGYPEQPNFPPRYNIAPTQPVPIVRLDRGQRHFALVRWGLVPSWVKDPKKFALVHVARGESVNEKPAFRNAMKRRRCLVPADGFYEWTEHGERKRPFFIRQKSGQPIAFAGLWETWEGPNGEEVETVAIITTPANRMLSEIAERMPAILPPGAFDPWLDCAAVDATTAAAFIVPAPEDLLEAYPVSTAVNRLIRVSFGPFQLGDLAEGAVEEVKTRVLREQLGERIAVLSGADFSAPIVSQYPALRGEGAGAGPHGAAEANPGARSSPKPLGRAAAPATPKRKPGKDKKRRRDAERFGEPELARRDKRRGRAHASGKRRGR